jgi:hypothetical protein
MGPKGLGDGLENIARMLGGTLKNRPNGLFQELFSGYRKLIGKWDQMVSETDLEIFQGLL